MTCKACRGSGKQPLHSQHVMTRCLACQGTGKDTTTLRAFTRWRAGELLIVARRGSVLLAVMKEPGDGRSVVRLVDGDDWVTVENERLYSVDEHELAVRAGILEVRP